MGRYLDIAKEAAEGIGDEPLTIVQQCETGEPATGAAEGTAQALSKLPPGPPDRPGMVTELILKGGRDGVWSWRQRRMDNADRAYLLYLEQGE